MDHEGMDILRQPAKEGAMKEWEDYLARTKVCLTVFRLVYQTHRVCRGLWSASCVIRGWRYS